MNLQHLTLVADRALLALVKSLEQIADRSPRFAVKPNSVLHRVEEAAATLAQPAGGAETAGRTEGDTGAAAAMEPTPRPPG